MTVQIRPARLSDLEAMIGILNPFILDTAVTFDTEPYDVERRQPWFSQFSEQGRYQCFVAEVDGSVVGYANSGPLRPKRAYDTSVEVSVYVKSGNEGNGLGSQLYQSLFAALELEDVHRAHALVTLPNSASVALHKKFGFYEVGTLNEAGRKFEKYHSVLWLERPF